jgi:UDP-N-acetylmuramate dehydrogenase
MNRFDLLLDQLQREGYGERLLLNEPLSRHTSFAVGGPADALIVAQTLDELARLVRLAWLLDVPLLMIGGGTNILVADAGVRGLVIVNACEGLAVDESGLLRVEPGKRLAELARWSVAEGWAGLQWAVGIPGTVGGAVVGNAGAYGGCMADIVRAVRLLLPGGALKRVDAAALEYGYRTSALKRQGGQPRRGQTRRAIVLEAELALTPSDREALAAEAARINDLRAARTPRGCCAGSMFKRTAQYPAGFLIEQAGLKGERIGGAQVSPLHANFLMNVGDASAADVRALMEKVQQEVWQTFAQHLDPEVELVGEW